MTAKTAKAGTKPVVDQIKKAAKDAYAKGTSAAGEIKDLTKANFDAVTESGKILGAGLKELGEGYVAGSRAALEIANEDFKALTAVKSPFDLFKLQSSIFSRNVNAVLDLSSKNTNAVLKLSKDAAAPIAKRVEAVTNSVRKAA